MEQFSLQYHSHLLQLIFSFLLGYMQHLCVLMIPNLHFHKFQNHEKYNFGFVLEEEKSEI